MTKKDFIIEIPQGILDFNEKNKGLVTPDYMFEWQDVVERRIFLNGGVDDFTLDSITYNISRYNNNDNKNNIPVEKRIPIKLFVNSDGGGLHEGMHIVDIIKMSKTPVWTICQSRVYSSGGIIFIAGHKRFCYPSSSFLLHSGSMGAGGKTDSVMDTIEFSKRYEDKVKQLFLENTLITEKMYIENYRREWFIMADEMLELGIADKITDEIIF